MVNKCGGGRGLGVVRDCATIFVHYPLCKWFGIHFFFQMHSLVALFHMEFIRYKIMQSYDFSHKWGKAFEFDIR